MKKIIVTTTIHKPTKAILRFCEKQDWQFIIVGDLKTPHEKYLKLQKQFPNILYLGPEDQEKKYKKLSDAIGWNNVQRRNIGFVEAYKLMADIVATVDDDNIPYDNWGEDIYVGQEIDCDLYEPELEVFDPLSVTANNHLWHRGFPIEYVTKRHWLEYKGRTRRKVLVQANLWDGDPDVDAICRLCFKPIVKFSDIQPYCSNKISPFNTQNTIIAREILPYYAVLPYTGRMDDIWMSYIIQKSFPNSVIYDKATVYQERNQHDLVKNLENELLGYSNTLKLIQDLNNYEKYLPEKTIEFYRIYRNSF